MGNEAPRQVLLMGASGFLGANLYQRLCREGFNVTPTCRPSSNLWRYALAASVPKFERLDVTDRQSVMNVIVKYVPDIVIYLPSTSFNPPPRTFSDHLMPNVIGLAHMLDALSAHKETHLVYAGSGAAAGSGTSLSEDAPDKPTTQLGVAKAMGSALVRSAAQTHGVHASELRLFTPFGPLESPGRAIPAMILAALRGESLDMTAGHQKRDFIFVDDVVDAFVGVLRSPPPAGSVLNICSGRSHSIREVATLLEQQMARSLHINWDAVATRPDEILDMSGPTDRASKLIGWYPKTSLKDGLAKSVQWIEQHQNALGLG